ncbi:TPA: hypothetical protein R4C62_000877 [Salmonella enterica subsp. enterica serovar Oranienburg]|nr:hypothetical protein [Salmonella enterica subsp. enterica serovar Oranienburg]
MSNKVQVIFTFELKDHTEQNNPGRGVKTISLVHANVQSHGLDVTEKDDGPHVVYAHILMQNTPAVISFLNDEFKRAARAIGHETHIHDLAEGNTSGNTH